MAAQNTVNSVQQSDTQFLSKLSITPDMIAHTAQKYGISQQEVITQLRANAAAKARSKPVTRQAPEFDNSEDIGSTKSPDPASPGIMIDGEEPN